MGPRGGRKAGHYAAVAAAGVLLAGALVAAYVAILADGMRCDDSCPSEPEPGTVWWLDPDAVQWSVQLWLAVGALALAAGALVLVRKRRYVLAAICAATTVGLALEWMSILHEARWGGF